MNSFYALPEYLDLIDPHPTYAGSPKAKINLAAWMRRESIDNSRVLVDDGGKFLAIVLMRQLYDRVYQCSAYVDKSVEHCGFRYVRAMRRIADEAFARPGVVRLQIYVRADEPWAMKWATALGFSFEGRLRKFGEEEIDYFLYARVRE